MRSESDYVHTPTSDNERMDSFESIVVATGNLEDTLPLNIRHCHSPFITSLIAFIGRVILLQVDLRSHIESEHSAVSLLFLQLHADAAMRHRQAVRSMKVQEESNKSP